MKLQLIDLDMKLQEVKQLIRIGFENPTFFKRSTWCKVTRVMDYLCNKGFIEKNNGSVKYKTFYGGTPLEEDITRWANSYMKSPFVGHLETLKSISKDMHLPLNDGRVLERFMNTKN